MFFKFLLTFLFIGSLYSDWMDNQIQTDLKDIKTVTLNQLNDTEKLLRENEYGFLRVKIHNGNIDYIVPPYDIDYQRINHFKGFLGKLQTSYKLPDMDFIIALGDACTIPLTGKAPVFCIAKFRTQNQIILIPEVWTCRDGFYEKIEQAGAEFPWSNKIPIAFWRGSTTGGFYDAETWGKIPRTQLVLFSKSYPNHLDCAFHHFVQGDQEAEMLLQNARLMGIGCDPILQVRYKYLIAIDGNTNPSSLKWQLFSGSPVLKNDTVCDEWYSNALVPYEHYIPYKMDFSDLIEQIDWLRQNDEMAKYIAEQARIFANQHLKSDQYQLYTYKALLAYSKLLRNY